MSYDAQDRRRVPELGELVERQVGLGELLDALVHRLAVSVNADRGTLYLLDRRKHELFARVADLPELDEIRLALGQGVAGYVAETGRTVNVPTTDQDERWYAGVDARTGYHTQSILAVPMRDGDGQILGVVQLLNKKDGPFTEEDALRLDAMAEQAAAVVEASTFYEDLFAEDGPAPHADDEGKRDERYNGILGESEPMRAAYRLTTRAAQSAATVLIIGESGTGKELFARAVHVNSDRRDEAFVKVDCAALPASLIENELFGHERGAYTGADQKAEGKVAAADRGTLFLDEIGELPLEAQGKLLRLLQDREYARVGGAQTVTADVRVVAATNRDLAALVEAGQFRADLYYRLRVVQINLPPLRERGRADLERLVRHFVQSAARRHGRPVPRLSAAALDRLAAHRWPGNVRELENCIESAVVISDDAVLDADELPLPSRDLGPARAPSGPSLPVPGDVVRPLEDVERDYVLSVLEHVDGNRSEAARLLGISRSTLKRKLARWED